MLPSNSQMNLLFVLSAVVFFFAIVLGKRKPHRKAINLGMQQSVLLEDPNSPDSGRKTVSVPAPAATGEDSRLLGLQSEETAAMKPLPQMLVQVDPAPAATAVEMAMVPHVIVPGTVNPSPSKLQRSVGGSDSKVAPAASHGGMSMLSVAATTSAQHSGSEGVASVSASAAAPLLAVVGSAQASDVSSVRAHEDDDEPVPVFHVP